METTLNPTHFKLAQLGTLVLFLVVAWLIFRPKQGPSQFKNRESDRAPQPKSRPHSQRSDSLANAKMKIPTPPRAHPGLNLNGKPHEILGVPLHASESEIQSAFREKMKAYHPDSRSTQSPEQQAIAHEISQKLLKAREELLLQLRNRK
jgi:DnaJ-domain-containing protein 1